MFRKALVVAVLKLSTSVDDVIWLSPFLALCSSAAEKSGFSGIYVATSLLIVMCALGIARGSESLLSQILADPSVDVELLGNANAEEGATAYHYWTPRRILNVGAGCALSLHTLKEFRDWQADEANRGEVNRLRARCRACFGLASTPPTGFVVVDGGGGGNGSGSSDSSDDDNDRGGDGEEGDQEMTTLLPPPSSASGRGHPGDASGRGHPGGDSLGSGPAALLLMGQLLPLAAPNQLSDSECVAAAPEWQSGDECVEVAPAPPLPLAPVLEGAAVSLPHLKHPYPLHPVPEHGCPPFAPAPASSSASLLKARTPSPRTPTPPRGSTSGGGFFSRGSNGAAPAPSPSSAMFVPPVHRSSSTEDVEDRGHADQWRRDAKRLLLVASCGTVDGMVVFAAFVAGEEVSVPALLAGTSLASALVVLCSWQLSGYKPFTECVRGLPPWAVLAAVSAWVLLRGVLRDLGVPDAAAEVGARLLRGTGAK